MTVVHSPSVCMSDGVDEVIETFQSVTVGLQRLHKSRGAAADAMSRRSSICSIWSPSGAQGLPRYIEVQSSRLKALVGLCWAIVSTDIALPMELSCSTGYGQQD